MLQFERQSKSDGAATGNQDSDLFGGRRFRTDVHVHDLLSSAPAILQ